MFGRERALDSFQGGGTVTALDTHSYVAFPFLPQILTTKHGTRMSCGPMFRSPRACPSRWSAGRMRLIEKTKRSIQKG